MSLLSKIAARVLRLPRAETSDIGVERDLEIAMKDGVVLLADRYYPRDLVVRPTILMRSVYTDRLKAGWQAEMIAEQGFQVLVVSGRGVCGSEGQFTPFITEREDGAAVVDWLKDQEWFDGELGTLGASYLGYTQWAIAEYAADILGAMSTQFISSDLRSMVFPGNGFALELWMWWMSMIETQEKPTIATLWNTLTGGKRRARIANHLPLSEIDRLVTGKTYEFWQEWLEHESPGDRWWGKGDLGEAVPGVRAPNHLLGGWYDFMLPGLIHDYEALVDAGQKPFLTVGPWTHFDTKGSQAGTREGVIWLRAHLLGQKGLLRDLPVRVYVMGADEWRQYRSWPPEAIETQKWHLHKGRRFSMDPPRQSSPDLYSYNPEDPTPSIGGAARSFGHGRPSIDNRPLEARADVLTYDSDVLSDDLDIIGRATATLFAASTRAHSDFFVRICDVEPSGKSLNVCDGLCRITPDSVTRAPDGTMKVVIELWPTAYRFRSGHAIRIQVSSGSFPRWNRNLGTGEPLATARSSSPSKINVYHDPGHPSSVTLPVCVG